MLVVFLMAAHTFLGGVLEHGALMALFTFHFAVLSQQGKTAFVMVKLGRLFPTAFTMTALAILTQ